MSHNAAVSHPVIGESSVLLGHVAPCTPAPKYIGKILKLLCTPCSLPSPTTSFWSLKWAANLGRGPTPSSGKARKGEEPRGSGSHQVAVWVPSSWPQGGNDSQVARLLRRSDTDHKGTLGTSLKNTFFSTVFFLSNKHTRTRM